MKKLVFLLLVSNIAGYAQFVNSIQTPVNSSSSNSIMSIFGAKFTNSGHFFMGYNDMMNTKYCFGLDTQGDTLFYKKMGSGNSYFYELTETSDGAIYGFNTNNDSLIINKHDGGFNRRWQRKILLPSAGGWGNVAATPVGINNFYFVGCSYWSSGSHVTYGMLDTSGTPMFTRSIDLTATLGINTQQINPIAAQVKPSGNIIVGATTYASNSNDGYILLMELDLLGNVVWARTYTNTPGGNPLFYAYSIFVTSNNEILISGNRTSPQGTAYMRLDQMGNFLWAKSISDATYGAEIRELSNGELALHIAHSNQVPDAVSKNMLAVLDANGNIRRTRSFGLSAFGSVCAVGEDAAGRIVGYGYSTSNKFCIYNMDTLGNATGCFDVISSLPVATWTANFNSQAVSSVVEINSGVINQSVVANSSEALSKNSPGILTSGTVSDPLCHGTFGSVTINPSGGSSPYSYKWSNGTNSQNLLNVPGGVYVVRVADNDGCVALDTFNVIEPAQLATSYSVSNVTCFGSHNGTINVTTSGGTPNYHWQWTTQDTTEDLSNLSGGFYQLTITDANGCTKTLAVSVSEPQQLIAGILSSQNVRCHGACDGSLGGVVSGGTAPYTYLWNNPGSATTTTVGGLCPGNYLFSVTDAHNCFTFANAVITEPAALSLSTSEDGSLCGGSTGMAVAQVAGGVSPYTYQWSNSITNDTASALMTGMYTVTATDANNCAVSSVVNVGLVTPTPDICLVTVDSLSTHNILVWDKTAFSNAAYFNIYREDITNNYTLIAAVNYDSLSEYHDYDTTMADPNVTTKRYKISVVDTCGNESAKSNFHNTIFIQHNNGTFTWNTYTIQNSPNPVTSYRLMRDNNATGNWQQIGITAGTQNVLNDPNYSSYASTADWRVETVWGISCTPTLRQSNGTAAAIVKSKSNISNNRMVGVKENASGVFGMYPNPATDVVTLVFDKAGFAKIEIMNTLGEIVRTVNTTMQQSAINTSDLTSGVYYVKVSLDGKQGVCRLVVQK